jgi:hypothetical protein
VPKVVVVDGHVKEVSPGALTFATFEDVATDSVEPQHSCRSLVMDRRTPDTRLQDTNHVLALAATRPAKLSRINIEPIHCVHVAKELRQQVMFKSLYVLN